MNTLLSCFTHNFRHAMASFILDPPLAHLPCSRVHKLDITILLILQFYRDHAIIYNVTPNISCCAVEIVAKILCRLPDFSSLFSMIESCKLACDTFQSFSNTIVFTIFENFWMRITQTYRAALPCKIPASHKPSTRKLRTEFIRKQSRPTSTTAKHCKPLLDQLGLVIRRKIIPKAAAVVILYKAGDMGFSQVLLDRMLERTIRLRGQISDKESLFAIEFNHLKGSTSLNRTISDDLRKAIVGDTRRSMAPKPSWKGYVDPDFSILMEVIENLVGEKPVLARLLSVGVPEC